MAKSKKVVSPQAVIIHETNDNGRHRIVRVVDGKSQYGEWAAHNEIAKLDNLRAATNYYADSLPQGVFTTTSKSYVEL